MNKVQLRAQAQQMDSELEELKVAIVALSENKSAVESLLARLVPLVDEIAVNRTLRLIISKNFNDF